MNEPKIEVGQLWRDKASGKQWRIVALDKSASEWPVILRYSNVVCAMGDGSLRDLFTLLSPVPKTVPHYRAIYWSDSALDDYAVTGYDYTDEEQARKDLGGKFIMLHPHDVDSRNRVVVEEPAMSKQWKRTAEEKPRMADDVLLRQSHAHTPAVGFYKRSKGVWRIFGDDFPLVVFPYWAPIPPFDLEKEK